MKKLKKNKTFHSIHQKDDPIRMNEEIIDDLMESLKSTNKDMDHRKALTNLIDLTQATKLKNRHDINQFMKQNFTTF